MQKSNILDILFKYVKNIDRIIDKKGTKYVRFTYDSVEETLNRKFILALKTYTMMNHQFVGSHSCPQAGNQPITNLIDIVNEHRIVTLLSDR